MEALMTKDEARARETEASRRYSANVRAEIARAGRTQTAVARAVGMTWPTWQRRVSGDVPWKASELEAVAKEVGVPLSTLLGDEDR
jgi:hypothetical protein